MAKKAYIGVNGIARKIKKGYVGISGVARKIKKAYMGIGGVARPCFSGGELAYYGEITPLDLAREYLAAASVGNHALFGGGSYYGEVFVYDTSFTVTRADNLGANVSRVSAAANRNYAIFAGGELRNSLNTNVITFYDQSLVKSTSTTPNSNQKAGNLFAVSTDDYAFFAGGINSNGSAYSQVFSYNASRSCVSAVDGLFRARGKGAGAAVGKYVFFAGGDGRDYYANVDIYDTSLSLIIGPELSATKYGLAGATVGEHALFAGGHGAKNTVDAYDASMTKTVAPVLALGRQDLVGVSLGDNALFAGGYVNRSNQYTNTVDVYDVALTRTSKFTLTVGRTDHAATVLANYALFGGGSGASGSLKSVEAFMI